MEEKEIRAQLEKELGSFAEATWTRFRRSSGFEEYREGKLDWQALKDLAEEEQGYVRELRLEITSREEKDSETNKQWRRRKPSQEDLRDVGLRSPKLSGEESLRAEVFEECLAEIASDDLSVREFRREVLNGKLLEPEQALKLITSPAAQALPLSGFEARKIPVLDHYAELKDYENDPEDGRDRATILLGPPDRVEELLAPADNGERPARLNFIDEDGRANSCTVWRWSLLGELQKLSEALAERFSWQEAEATWFVLTGHVPAVPPVKIRYRLEGDERFERGEVILTLAPCLPKETVATVYQSIQRRVLGRSRSRQLSTKKLKLLRFVMERTNAAELSLSKRRKLGGALQKSWDQDNPHWAYGKYKQPTSHFWRDYDDAWGRVVNPEYRRPHELRTKVG